MTDNEKTNVEIKIPFVSEKINIERKEYINLIKFLLFIMGYVITSFFHLMNIMNNSYGDFYFFMIGDSIMKSIPEGFVVGLIFTFFKKK